MVADRRKFGLLGEAAGAAISALVTGDLTHVLGPVTSQVIGALAGAGAKEIITRAGSGSHAPGLLNVPLTPSASGTSSYPPEPLTAPMASPTPGAGQLSSALRQAEQMYPLSPTNVQSALQRVRWLDTSLFVRALLSDLYQSRASLYRQEPVDGKGWLSCLRHAGRRSVVR